MIRKYSNKANQQQKLDTCRRRHQSLALLTNKDQNNNSKMSTTTLKATPSFELNNNSSKQQQQTTVTMSSLAADLCKAAVQTPPMEAAVVVNSIIYSKPSFCSIVVDIGGDMETNTTAATFGQGGCNSNSKMAVQMPGKSPTSTACLDRLFPGLGGYLPTATTTMPLPLASAAAAFDQDAHVYMMCTTMNGSIHHKISEMCDNLIAMGLFGSANSEDDDDSMIEFAYDDEDHNLNHIEKAYEAINDEDDDEDEEDDDDDDDNETAYYEYDDEYDCLDDGNDVVDFVMDCPIATALNEYICCDKKKKKVHFNTKPVVHVMHTWNYAYRAARKGNWEMYARDRERFKLRIHRASFILNPILEREHRQKIYEQRFAQIYAEEEKPKVNEKQKQQPPQPKNPNQKPKQKQRKKRRKRRRHDF